MKKFIRNLLSGYFLVILILLIELGVVVFLQFYMDDLADYIVSKTGASNESTSLIIALAYLALRSIIFIVALIIFFKIITIKC